MSSMPGWVCVARWLAGRRPLAWIGHELGRRGHRRHGVVLRLEQLLGLVARVEQEAAARRRRGALRGLGTYVVRLLRQLLSGCGRALSARRPITGRRRAALVSGLENGQERRGRVGGVHNRRACCLAISVFLSHCVGQ